MNSDDMPNVSDKVEILSTEDEKIKAVGEILSSDSSRQILKLLFNQSLSANQISQKTNLSLPLVIHHLKKMQGAGVVKITNVGKNTKSHDVKFYTVDKVAIVILPSEMHQPAKKSKSLFNSFTRIHRLATLGGVSIAAWLSSQFIQKTSVTVENDGSIKPIVPEAVMTAREMSVEESETMALMVPPSNQVADPILDILWSAIVVSGIIIAGLIIEVIATKKQQKNA